MPLPAYTARAFLEGRLSEALTSRISAGNWGRKAGWPVQLPTSLGSCADFWQFPTVSMGLGPIMAIYQARFNRVSCYDRGLKDSLRAVQPDDMGLPG